VEGDAKVNGRALAERDDGEVARFVGGLEHEMDPSEVGLFRADVTDASLTRVAVDWLVIDSWREGDKPRQRRRK